MAQQNNGALTSGSRVGVVEAAASLAVLVGDDIGRARADAECWVSGTACRRAVSISRAASGDKLLAVSSANVLGARNVGGDGCKGNGDDYVPQLVIAATAGDPGKLQASTAVYLNCMFAVGGIIKTLIGRVSECV